VWLCAIAGSFASFYGLKKQSRIETACYVLMGLVVLVAFKTLLEAVEFSVVAWLIAEGVCYITGAVFYSINKKKYMHTVFHFFVLLGTVCHMMAVWDILNLTRL
jgi:hemolysin III